MLQQFLQTASRHGSGLRPQRRPYSGSALPPELQAALVAYRERYGDLLVPPQFVVPAHDDEVPPATAPPPAFPEVCHGLALGRAVKALRARARRSALGAEDVAALRDMGFVLCPAEWRWERALAALRAYREAHGHLRVPRGFVVPAAGPPWPEEARGLKLGAAVGNMRSTNAQFVRGHPERRALLDELGFVWGGERDRRWSDLCAALRAHRELRGDLLVPASFVVPAAAPWPEEAWGLNLGSSVHNIRTQESFVRGHPERRALLDELGFEWGAGRDRRWSALCAALRAYCELRGDLLVPKSFVVPAAAPWPEEAWGLNLGSSVHNIRAGGDFLRGQRGAAHFAELDALGFVWDTAEQRWSELLEALRTFVALHGDALVPAAFVVPRGEPAWPAHLWGLKLGSRASDLRAGGTLVRDRPDRRHALLQLGFVCGGSINLRSDC